MHPFIARFLRSPAPSAGAVIAVASMLVLPSCAAVEWLGARFEGGQEAPVSPAVPVDIYSPQGDPSVPIESATDAIRSALGDRGLIQHLQDMDDNYSGRRKPKLDWKARAQLKSQAESKAGSTENQTPDDAVAALNQTLERDGAYWAVTVESNVRGSSAMYVCQVGVAKSGEILTPFGDPKQRCKFEER